MLTIVALILAVDALTAAFLLGLVHCRDVTPPLPRRVPGAALVLDVPAPMFMGQSSPDCGGVRSIEWSQQTIGERARQRRDAVRDYYEQKAGGW